MSRVEIAAYEALCDKLKMDMRDAISHANSEDLLGRDRIFKSRELHTKLGKYLEDYDAAQQKLKELR